MVRAGIGNEEGIGVRIRGSPQLLVCGLNREHVSCLAWSMAWHWITSYDVFTICVNSAARSMVSDMVSGSGTLCQKLGGVAQGKPCRIPMGSGGGKRNCIAHGPESAVAAPGEARRCLPTAGETLRFVHRRF